MTAILSVMIIDDNETDRYILKRLLKRSKIDHKVFEAENGKVALDFLTDYQGNIKKYPETYPPMMVFLDINMPMMNGFEFLEKYNDLRDKNSAIGLIKFAIFSSSEEDNDLKNTLEYDFVKDYVNKGEFDVNNLKDLIKRNFADINFE